MNDIDLYNVLNQTQRSSPVPSSTKSLSNTPHLSKNDVSLTGSGILIDPDIEHQPPFYSLDSFLLEDLIPSFGTSESKAPPPPPADDDSAGTTVSKTDDPSSQPNSIVNNPESLDQGDNSHLSTQHHPQHHPTSHQQTFEIVQPLNCQTSDMANNSGLSAEKKTPHSPRRTRSSQATAPTNSAGHSGVKTRHAIRSKKRKRHT